MEEEKLKTARLPVTNYVTGNNVYISSCAFYYSVTSFIIFPTSKLGFRVILLKVTTDP